MLPTHHANEHKEPEPVQKADTLAAGPESSSSTDEHIEHHTSESTQPLPPSVSLQPPSPAGTAQKLSPGENSPKAETTGANCDGADADAPYEPDAHPSSEANHELVLILQLNHHEPREDPWNPVPHVVKAIERERSRGREKRVNVVEGGEVYSVCAGKHNGLGDEHGDGVGHGDEGVDVYIFMEGLRAWNDPPLKTVHNYIDLFRQILEVRPFIHSSLPSFPPLSTLTGHGIPPRKTHLPRSRDVRLACSAGLDGRHWILCDVGRGKSVSEREAESGRWGELVDFCFCFCFEVCGAGVDFDSRLDVDARRAPSRESESRTSWNRACDGSSPVDEDQWIASYTVCGVSSSGVDEQSSSSFRVGE